MFASYLVDRTPPQDFVDRYRAANRTLLREPVEPRDEAIVGFVRRHPWSISLLDAGCGVLRPTGLLRNKILIMAAVLETSPEFADEFLPRHTPRVPLVMKIIALGALGVIRALLGILLYPIAARP